MTSHDWLEAIEYVVGMAAFVAVVWLIFRRD